MDWLSLAGGLEQRDSLLNQSNDPRIGSGRDNSTGGTLSHITSSGTNSSSAASLGSTFVPVLIYSGVCLAIFVIFRRKCQRVYAPRTLSSIRRYPHVPVPALPATWLTWAKDVWQIDDKFILNNTSLDGFLFLRYLRVLATICFAGCVIAWPVLLSVNATGGNELSQLDLLTIGDVASPVKFYAHVAIAWVFFGFILFMISRECIYYINLRQAYLMAPQHAQRLSARTVLFTCVPDRFLDEHRVRKLYGDSVKNVWIPRNTRALQRLVDERESAAVRLEKAEIELIRKANLARKKKHGVSSDKALPLPVSMAKAPSLSLTKKTSFLDFTSSASSSCSHPSLALPPLSPSISRPLTSSPPTAPSILPPPRALQRRASAPYPSGAAAPTLSAASTANVLQDSLSPGIIHEIVKINGVDQGEELSDQAEQKLHDTFSTGLFDNQQGRFDDEAEPPCATVVKLSSPCLRDSDTTEIGSGEADQPLGGGEVADVERKITKTADEKGDGETEEDYTHPYGFSDTLPDVRGSVAAQWLPAEARPRHRPLANFGRSVDTIRWTRMRVKSLNKTIARLRRRFRAGDGTTLSSMFVEFDTQAAAQVAFQVLSHHQPLHMSPRFIGVRPEDIIWSSLRMRWWERIVRRFLVMGAIAAAIVFWSIPAALVGVASNISFLSSKFFFLHWIADLPMAITGVIQGLLPAVALSLLMAAVPGMLRVCARAAGVVSEPMVELFCQHAYFCFQVVQVFLITTITSAASAALTEILTDPLSIKNLLSQNLPKASNFYLSYITVQCLAGGALGLAHFIDLFRHTVLARTIQHPRRAVRNFQRLKQPHWGGVFPVYTNMGVIAISYTCIAPLILAFACVGMCIIHQVYKYNLVYAYDADRDSKGLHYPRALLHLTIGLYLAEVCLIGLFSIQSAVGPVILMVVFLVFTLLVHISLSDAVSPLLYSLPRTLALEDEDLAAGRDDLRRKAEQEAAEAAASSSSNAGGGGGGLNADYYNTEVAFGDEGYGDEADSDDELHAGPVATRGIDGAADLLGMAKDWGREALQSQVKAQVKAMKLDLASFRMSSYIPWIKSDGSSAGESTACEIGPDGRPIAPKPKPKPNFLVRWLHPQLYEDYTFLRKTLMPAGQDEPLVYPDDYTRRGYWPPEMWKPTPKLWIPRDDARVSRQEVAHTRKVMPITDRGAWLTPAGKVVADLDKAPFLEPIYLIEATEEICLAKLRKHVDDFGADVSGFRFSDPEGPITISTSQDDDVTTYSNDHLPSELGLPFPVKTIRFDYLTELDRLYPQVDLVTYAGVPTVGGLAADTKAAFKYWFMPNGMEWRWFELQLWARLPRDHPHIVPFDAVVLDHVRGGVIGFTSVYIPGGTLEETDATVRPFRLSWFQQLLSVVDDLNYRYGIMHQDIAARNLVVDAQDNLRIFDFNFSSRISEYHDPHFDDAKAVIFTLYEIMTLDEHYRQVRHAERNAEALLLQQWEKHPDVKLDSEVQEFRQVLDAWLEKRKTRELKKVDTWLEWPPMPKPPNGPWVKYGPDGAVTKKIIPSFYLKRQHLIKLDEPYLDWERPASYRLRDVLKEQEKEVDAPTTTTTKDTGKSVDEVDEVDEVQ
ncbi:hypothetical protein SEPCBS119000_002114 [Sporothrix epigloea]|uniref:EKC/KEOPS complex subunit BUD32 n=1 Tax=Sporothrix epigloea TaxID=1892477 RepID=A0ABP0DEE1_9PEZI